MPLEFPFDGANLIGMTWPVTRTPMWKTLVSTAASAKEYRTQLHPYPQWKWKLDMGYLWDDYTHPMVTQNFMWSQLAAFYNLVQGQTFSWLYLDPWDNSINGQGFGNGNGTQTAFQLFKQLLGPPSEPIQYVNPSGLVIKVNGVATSAYTLTQQPTVITFTTPPASGASLTWIGQFYYLCRFTKDSFDFTHEWYGMYMCKDLEFQSVFC